MTKEELEFLQSIDAEPEAQCSVCHRKTWDIYAMGEPCGMTQPDGSLCYGKFIAIVNEEAQNELAGMLLADGYDLDEMVCRTCGALYDGGQCCSYCGDTNPTDDPEIEFEDY